MRYDYDIPDKHYPMEHIDNVKGIETVTVSSNLKVNNNIAIWRTNAIGWFLLFEVAVHAIMSLEKDGENETEDNEKSQP